jgi:PhnB protein
MPKFELTPRLIVKDGTRALEFYCAVFGGQVRSRFEDDNLGGRIVHAELEVGGTIFNLAEEDRTWGNDSAASLGGSPVLLEVLVDDPDAVAARMVDGGAEIVIPIADQFYGRRQGRVRDPFGHLWVVGKQIEALSAEEIRARMSRRSDAE